MPDGDPAALRQSADRFDAIARSAHATVAVSGDLSADLAALWSGPTATLAAGEGALLAARARCLLDQLHSAGGGLRAYAATLEHVQAVIRRCLFGEATTEQVYAREVKAAVDLPLLPDHKLRLLTAAADRRDTDLRGLDRRYQQARADLHDARRVLTRCLISLNATALPRPTPLAPLSLSPLPIDEELIGSLLIGDLPLVRQELTPPDGEVIVDIYRDAESGLPEGSVEQALLDAGIAPGDTALAQFAWGIGTPLTMLGLSSGSALVVAGPRSFSSKRWGATSTNRWTGRAGTVLTGLTSAAGQVHADAERYPQMPAWKRAARTTVATLSTTGLSAGAAASCATVPMLGPALSVLCATGGSVAGARLGRALNSAPGLKPTRDETRTRERTTRKAAWD